MGFFEFLDQLGYPPQGIRRMELRWDHVIKPFIADIRGARVLDVAAHDGRWSYAFAGAGAREVVAVEGRREVAAKFAAFPEGPLKSTINLVTGDLFPFCRTLVDRNEKFDIVAIFGVFYHIMSHYELLVLAARMQPKLIILDSTLLDVPYSVVRIQMERTERARNAIPYFDGQSLAPVGIVSLPALQSMAKTVGYTTKQVPWTDVADGIKTPAFDYFRSRPKRRFTIEMRPA